MNVRIRVIGLAGVLALGTVLICGCMTNGVGTESTSQQDVRFHNWWNYYERGEASMRDGNTESAREDFERCLDLRPGARFGNPREALRVRTYGVHVVDNYFPNREMGICLYLAGHPADARPLLEKSLQQVPSGRARHYLNLANRDLLAQTKPSPPTIEIAAASRSRWTRERVRTLQGVIHAAGRTHEIEVGGEPLFIELAETEQPFSRAIPLHSGTNIIHVRTRDLLGQEALEIIAWTADWKPPRLILTRVDPDGSGWDLEGYCVDDQMLGGVTAGDQRVDVAADGIRAPIRVRLKAGEHLPILAEDPAGNRLLTTLSAEAIARDWAQAGGWQVAVAGAAAVLPAGSPADQKRPVISLSAGFDEPRIVYHNQFFLDGVVRDRGGITELTVQGEPQLDAGQASCIEHHFSTLIDLDEGTNLVWVTAHDRAGNCASQQVVLIHRKAEFLEEQYRLTAAMPPLANPDNDATAIKAHHAIAGRVRARPARFRLLERNEGWEAVLQEQQLSLSRLADPDIQLRVGKLLSAEVLFLGSLLREGRGTTLRVNVVESENGETLFTEDVYSENLAQELGFQAEGLVLKIKQRLPLLNGTVLRVEGGRPIIDIGADHGNFNGSKFVVAQKPDDASPDEAAIVCRDQDRIVQLSVTEVAPNRASTIVQPENARSLIRPGDRVFAR